MNALKATTLAIGLALAGAAIAAPPTIEINSPTAAAGAMVDVVVTFTNSTAPDPLAAGFQFVVTFDDSVLTAGASSSTLSNQVCNPGAAGVLNCGGFSGSGDYPATGTVTIPMTVAGGAMGTSPLGLSGHQSFDGVGDDIPGINPDPADGVFTVGAGTAPPMITYAPAPGVGTVTLAMGAGSIVATPSGGSGTGAPNTTTVNGCVINNVVGSATFGNPAGINLSFVGATTTAQNLNLTCGQVPGGDTTADLICDETRGSGAATPQTWQLSCPAGAAGMPPVIDYTPIPGSQVSFVGTPGTTINAVIAVNGTGGSGAGAGATARVSDCQVSPALSPPIFACQPSGGNVLDFTPGGVDPGDITCSCAAPSTGQVTGTLTCEETSPLSTGTPVVRTWNLACPGVPGVCGDLAFAPNPGLVQFAGGAATIGVSHSGGSIGNDTTFNGCTITGANAASFGISNAPINFAFTGGTAAANDISLACTNTTAAPVQATLSCNQVCDVNNTPRNWTLECPAGGGPPPVVDAVPVPSGSDLTRILLAAMLVLIGMGAVTIRSRS